MVSVAQEIWEGYVSGYHKIVLKKVSLNFPIIWWFSITALLSLFLLPPRQTFPLPYALVTDQGTIPGNVVVVNLEDKKVVNTIPVGINPEGIVVDGNNSLAYVANRDSGSVSIIEINIPQSRTLDPPITVLGSPHHLDITSDGRYVLVTKTGTMNHGIDVINTTTKMVEQEIIPSNTLFAPRDIAIDAHYAYVNYPDDFTVLVLDLRTIPNSFSLDWFISTSPYRPGRLIPVFNIDSKDYVYVTTDNDVIQIDPVYLETIHPFPAKCFNAPGHLAFNPTWKDLYVSNRAGNSVTIINIDNPSMCSSIDVGISPYSIDLDPGTYAYVVNMGSGTISIIDISTSPGRLTDTISDPKLIAPIEIEIIEGPESLSPYEPSNPYPTDGEMGVSVSTYLSWEGGDPDYPDDTITYDVYLGIDLTTTGLEQVCSGIQHPNTFCTPSINPLEYGTTYYWMVVATDYNGETSEVPYPYWSFTTEETAYPCEVTLTPDSAMVRFGETLQFSASTTCSETDVSGDYIWDVTSSIGSSIDKNGLYTAGTIEGMDIVTVTDIANGEVTNSVSVTVVTGPLCEVTITPPSATVISGETITFIATTSPLSTGIECKKGIYLWEVNSPIGSSITQGGIYTAGINDTGEDIADIVFVTDTANGNITNVAEVRVVAKPQEEYIVVITPEEITLTSLHSSRFTVYTLEAETHTPLPKEECRYRWVISPRSTIGSTIDGYGTYGVYRAGLNNTRDLITETVWVYDTVHNDVSATATVTVLIRYESFYLPPGPLVTSYRMISIPLWPIDRDALRIITGRTTYNPYLIRLFRWDGELDEDQGGYIEYLDPRFPELEPGIGIWVITLPGGITHVDGTPVDTSQDFTITLPPGWAQIGHPFPFPVDWDQVDASTEVETPWTFTGIYLPSNRLSPWHGYFIYNNSSDPVTIAIPAQESRGEISEIYTPLSEKEEGWQLQIGVHTIPFFWFQDTYNFIGVSENSRADRDPKDLHKPPPIFPNQVSLYFSHEREEKVERFTTDFRSLDSQKEVFECVVSPDNGILSLMRLFWSDMAKVPEEYNMEFIDPETGITLNMREVSGYWFVSYLGIDKHFQISMTKTSH